jgi:hypothetical protein
VPLREGERHKKEKAAGRLTHWELARVPERRIGDLGQRQREKHEDEALLRLRGLDFRDSFSCADALSLGTAPAMQYVCTIGRALDACDNRALSGPLRGGPPRPYRLSRMRRPPAARGTTQSWLPQRINFLRPSRPRRAHRALPGKTL